MRFASCSPAPATRPWRVSPCHKHPSSRPSSPPFSVLSYPLAMRQSSIASSRQSTLQNPALNAAAQARLLEKKKEYEAVAALERTSAQFVQRIDQLGDDFDVMADAGKGAPFPVVFLRTE